MTEFRDELRYTREHEWAKEENGRIVVGITDYAQEQLGDIVEGGPRPARRADGRRRLPQFRLHRGAAPVDHA